MLDKLIPRPIVMLLQRLRDLNGRLVSYLFYVPTSLFALLLIGLLAYNGVTVFYVHVPTLPPEPANFSRDNINPHHHIANISSHSSSAMYVVRQRNSRLFLKTQFPNLHYKHDHFSLIKSSSTSAPKRPRRVKKLKPNKRKDKEVRANPSSGDGNNGHFAAKVKDFFHSGNCTTGHRFFMTWISSPDSFGERELFAVESLFRTNPSSCLAIVSESMDSAWGRKILRPFRERGFKAIVASPDYGFLFEATPAEAWFEGLRSGRVDPGEIAIGQNLSNLLRLCLLYKFGGVYADTDVIFLRSFSSLRNAVGAQSTDPDSGGWSRLNNAVLVFDRDHPLLLKFIREFAATFDGNKWGHNGPYLVSRVVARLAENPGFGYEVLPPSAFYPVDWRKIGGLFRSGDKENGSQKKWRAVKMRQIRSNSYAVHLWNRQSKRMRVESGSILHRMRQELCIFCDSVNNKNNNSNYSLAVVSSF